jgi:hypothetical protein
VAAPERYVQWINEHLGFNPRSQKVSDALAEFIVDDLRRESPKLDRAMESGQVQMALNFSVRTRVSERDVDLEFIVPAVVGPLGVVQIAVENKTIITGNRAKQGTLRHAASLTARPSPRRQDSSTYNIVNQLFTV